MINSVKITVTHEDEMTRDQVLDDLTLYAKAYLEMTQAEQRIFRDLFNKSLPEMYQRRNEVAMRRAGLQRIN